MGIYRHQIKQFALNALIEAVRQTGQQIYYRSQATALCYVPVRTGFLKGTGKYNLLTKGVEIQYSANYSAEVEFGASGEPITGEQKIYVGRFKKKDGTIVKAHTKTYKDKRLIAFRPKHSKFEYGEMIYRVVKEKSARKGQYFLSRATRDVISDNFVDNLRFFLKQLERI